MRDYCCYFLDARGHSLFPADISAEGLEAAKLHCFAILEEGHRRSRCRRERSRSGKGMSCYSDRRRVNAIGDTERREAPHRLTVIGGAVKVSGSPPARGRTTGRPYWRRHLGNSLGSWAERRGT